VAVAKGLPIVLPTTGTLFGCCPKRPSRSCAFRNPLGRRGRGTNVWKIRRRGSARDEVLLPPDRDGFETRVGIERPQEVADVVPHRLGADVELMRDLLGRAAMPEQTQHLGLPARQARMGRRRWIVLFQVFDLAEDADHMAIAATERNRADLDGHPLAVRVDQHDLVVRAGWWSDKVPGEDLPRTARFLGRDDRGELAATHVSHDLARRWIQPADDPVPVDHVSRDADPGDGVLDIAAGRVELGHDLESAPWTVAAQLQVASLA
jgi:hypothetical protein